MQTLKSNDAAGLVTCRGEWQSAARLGRRPISTCCRPEASEVLDGLVEPGELRSLFTTRVRRQTRRLSTAPTARSAEPDRGRARPRRDRGRRPLAADRRDRAGADRRLAGQGALRPRARARRADARCSVETRSKSVRGYALAGGEPPAWHKAEELALKPRAHGRRGARQRSCAPASSTGAPTRRRPSTGAIRRACTRCGWRCAACARRCRRSAG